MIVLLAVFVLMVVIGALADRSRRKKEAAAQPEALETVSETAPEIEPAPASVPEPEKASEPQPEAPRPIKVAVHRRTVKAMPPAVVPAAQPVPVGPDSAQDAVARLRRAQQMYNDGIITKREYKRARRHILDSI